MADAHTFFANTVGHDARRLRIRHALAELKRSKVMSGPLLHAHVVLGQMTPQDAELRKASLDDAIEILDALTRHDAALVATADHVRKLRSGS